MDLFMEEIEFSKNGRPRHSGMFSPGVSGNPSGRPKSDVVIRDLARQHTEDALNTLIEIAVNKKAPPSARVHAACAILDRGWGKPAIFVESNSNMTVNEFLNQLPPPKDCLTLLAECKDIPGLIIEE